MNIPMAHLLGEDLDGADEVVGWWCPFFSRKNIWFLGKEKHLWVLGVFVFLDFSLQLVCEFFAPNFWLVPIQNLVR